MKIIEFIRLVRKHLVLLIAVPVLLALLVFKLTSKPHYSFTSQTVLYTGLATGSTIEMDKTFNYFLTNTAFDNLLNIINSRETQQEVAIRLLSQHLLLPKPDPKYISAKSFDELKKLVPASIYSYVVNSNIGHAIDTNAIGQDADEKKTLWPSYVSHDDYEKTVAGLTAVMQSSDTNFVYKLLNFEDPHYSIAAISGVKAIRINNSDLIKLTYEVDDPGICQQTLAIYNEVCIKNYKGIKENRSDEVVKYFESQLKGANQQLKVAEDKLLDFNKSNNIINYYEQSKAVAVVKEDMEVDYNNKKAQLAGLDAAIKRIEEKLNVQQLVQLKSNKVLDKKKQLGDLNYEIAALEGGADTSAAAKNKIPLLKKQAEEQKQEIKRSIEELYSYQNTVEGLPLNNVLTQWLENVVEAENLRAKLMVMDQRNKDFQQQYSVYAPAGANIKRIEREISVSEQGYLELLHGLNLAKLKLQDNEMSSDLKTVDPPYYPITPIPTKRKVLVIVAAMLGAILLLAGILFMEYFDDSLKNLKHAAKVLNLPSLGMMPKIYLKTGSVNLPFIQNRLLEISTQHIQQTIGNNGKTTKTILVFSTMEKEGKTVVTGNIARKMTEQGKQVLILNHSGDYQTLKPAKRLPLLNRLLGYQDPRIDYNSSFLQNPANYLEEDEYYYCKTNRDYFKATTWQDIVQQRNIPLRHVPDYVFIELPALLYHSYPPALIANAEMSVLVCRSNRAWSEADEAVLNDLNKLTNNNIHFIINGVETQETESLLGELPKQRSALRKMIKNLLRFQFYTKNGV